MCYIIDYYINDSIASITTKWLSQLLLKVKANKVIDT